MSEEILSIRGTPLRSLMGVQIIGLGSYVPDRVVTNDDLARLGCDADWIIKRTGIRERRHVPPGMTTSDLATEAGGRCLEHAGVDREQVDLLILATLSPDRLMPATAPTVQQRLGLRCAAMDLSAACAGFTYALATAMQFITNGTSNYALVIGADANSRVVNPEDKQTYPLFGDGAGAVLLTAGSMEQGALAYSLGADGSGADLLCRPVGGAARPCHPAEPVSPGWYVQMEGRTVFKWAVRLVEENAMEVLNHAGLSSDQIDHWIFHQANTRILDAAAEALSVDRDRVVMHLDRYGNTSAGSIPIALDETFRSGKIKSGDRLLMSGFGAGLVWGTLAWRW